MEEALVKDDYNGSDVYKCEYLDKQDKYDWIAVKGGIYFNDEIEKACHYGIADKNVFSRYGSYICATKKRQDDNGNNVDALDNEGNHIHEWRVATVDEYCSVTEHVEATEQKVADEDLGEFTFDQKCTFQENLYVRNSKAGENSPWMSVEDYVARAPQGVIRRTAPIAATAAVVAKRYIPEGYFLFMNGYKENAIYYCSAKYFSCWVVEVEDVKAKLANTQNDIEIQKLLNIVCDYEGYKKASGYADEAVAYVAENVQLSEAEIKKTYVASAKRNDWHVATLDETLGTCDESAMNTHKIKSTNDVAYKCDCEIDYTFDDDHLEVSYNSCGWTKASSIEKSLNEACSAERAHASNEEKTFDSEEKYVCDVVGEENPHEHDWVAMTATAWCAKNKKLFGNNVEWDVYALCADNPVDGKTYLVQESSGDETWYAAEDFFRQRYEDVGENPCANNAKFIHALIGYHDDIFTYKEDNSYVHDFVCKNGKLVEAKDEQDACNAAFEKTDLCTYMKEMYEWNGTKWVKFSLEQYCNAWFNSLEQHYNTWSEYVDAICPPNPDEASYDQCLMDFWQNYQCSAPNGYPYDQCPIRCSGSDNADGGISWECLERCD
jgi:hypothetical protein